MARPPDTATSTLVGDQEEPEDSLRTTDLPPRRSRQVRLFAAAASGLLLAASFPPLDLGVLALVALVPLLWTWRGAGPRAGALYGGVAGMVFFGVIVSWTWFFGPWAYLPFALFLTLWWILAGAVIGALDARGLAPAPVVAAVWVLVEAGRGRWPYGGFSWGEVGYAFHDIPVARSLAAWGGVLLVSFMAVMANGFVLDLLLAGRNRLGARTARGRPRLQPAAAGLGALVAVVVGAHGALPDLRSTGTLRAALVQGNDKNRDLTEAELEDRYLPRNHLRLAAGIKAPVDLVVFPESSLDADPRRDDLLDDQLTALARRLDTVVVAGGNTEAPDDRLYNTTFLYRPGGRTSDLYHKRHLVPFGEYVPWRDALSFIDALQAIPRDYAPGKQETLFRIAGRRVGVLICFEAAFSPLARDYARHGAEAILVSTNNRSFRRSPNSAQHLAISQFRAAETGRPVLHAGISGRSGVIDARGRLLASATLFEPTVLVGTVRTMTGRTPYVAWGEWILALAVMVLVGAAAVGWRRRGGERA